VQVINFEITRRTQTINFPAPTINRVDRSAPLNATATSGLDVAFTSSDPTIAAVTGGTLTLLAEGTVTITASQAGDTNNYPAPAVSHTITVLPAASSNANLASLFVNHGALDPAFNAAVTSYTVSVGNGVSSITAMTAGRRKMRQSQRMTETTKIQHLI